MSHVHVSCFACVKIYVIYVSVLLKTKYYFKFQCDIREITQQYTSEKASKISIIRLVSTLNLAAV